MSKYMDIEDFNLGEGSRVSVVLTDGQLFTGTVTSYHHDKKTKENPNGTGTVEMTVE
jgi:hypothetical protein